MFHIGENTFYDWKNDIPMKILEYKRSEISDENSGVQKVQN
jgi:hypothetical protein